MAEGAPRSPRVRALDGLRAVGALLLMAHHLGGEAVSQALAARGRSGLAFLVERVGFSGAELFFVLSGALLARPYLAEGARFDASAYGFRRIARVFPPYLAGWALVGLSIFLASALPTWWTRAMALPSFRWRDFLLQVAILSPGAQWDFSFWSLNVDVVFYLLIPLLIPLLARLPRTSSAAAAVLVGTTGVALSAHAFAHPLLEVTPQPLRGLVYYAPAFAAGLLAGRATFSRRGAHALVAVGLALTLLAGFFPVVQRHAGSGLVWAGVVSRALDPSTKLARSLGGFPWVWLGERSYSLFVVHGPVLVLVCHLASLVIVSRGAAFFLVTRLGAVSSTVVLGLLVFRLVERRFARGLHTKEEILPAPAT